MIWLLVDSSSVGGIERHVATLAEALERRGVEAEVVLYAPHAGNPWLRQLDAAGLPYRTLDGSLSALYRAVKARRPALLHTHGYKANLLGRLVGRLSGVPVVATFHAGERAPFPVSLYQTADEWTSFASGRIAVSEAIRSALPYKSTLVGNFLLAPDQPPSAPLPRRIGFVGRLSHEKAPDRFCAMAASAHEQGLDAEWNVYGDGPMRAELERSFGHVVRFHGLVTDLAPVWSSLGLLVMPSRAEGLPMAALEALAAGIPVAAARVGALPTVVMPGRTGWLFDGADETAADAALAQWSSLSAADGIAMRASCWRHVRDTFSDRTQVPLILECYRRAGFTPPALLTPRAA